MAQGLGDRPPPKVDRIGSESLEEEAVQLNRGLEARHLN